MDVPTKPHLLGEIRIHGRVFTVYTRPTVWIEDIRQVVARHHNMTVGSLILPGQTRERVRPRQEAMWLCQQLTTEKLQKVGRRFGGKDRTTVIHAVNAINGLIDKGEESIIRDLLALLPMFPNVAESQLRSWFELSTSEFSVLQQWLSKHDPKCPYVVNGIESPGRLTYIFSSRQDVQSVSVVCLCGATCE